MESVEFQTAHFAFAAKLSTVKRLQERVNGDTSLPDDERDLQFESMFMSAFRALENLMEHCFVFSMQGFPDMSGKVAARFAAPGSRGHARDMLMGTQTLLDWTSSTTILRRHDTFLGDKESGI